MFRIGVRVAALAALLTLAVSSLAAAPSGAQGRAQEGVQGGSQGGSPPCLSDNGSDVERYFGLRGDAIWLNLQGHQPPCLTVEEGRTFSRTHGWIAQLASRAVYPAGYVPDHPAPIRDFVSKLTQARYVIHRDGEVEISRTVRRPALRERAKLGRFGDLFVAPDTTLIPGATIDARAPEWTTLEPFDSRGLAAGEHTIEIYWTLAEPHCDGFTTDQALSCLAAGEALSTSTTFTVID
jgi:hypothetical protein